MYLRKMLKTITALKKILIKLIKNLAPNPAPPASIISYALVAKLRAQEAMKTTWIPINPRKITTKQGYPAISFNLTDYKVRVSI